MTQRRRTVILAVGLALALVACRRAEPAAPGATVAEETTTTTTAPPLDVSRIPDQITVAYADAVMDALDRVLGDAIREMVRAEGPTRAFRDRLDAIYDEPEFSAQESDYGSLAAKDLDKFRPEPGDPATTVERILRGEPSCTLLAVDRDFAPFFLEPKEFTTKGFIALVPKNAAGDPAGLNPTAWSVVFDGATTTGEPPRNRC